MNINDRVKSVSQDINQFYNEAADIWNNRGKTEDGKPKGINPDTGTLWRKEYEEAAKKPENEGLTPYALFVIDITGYRERELDTPEDASDPAWSPKNIN